MGLKPNSLFSFVEKEVLMRRDMDWVGVRGREVQFETERKH